MTRVRGRSATALVLVGALLCVGVLGAATVPAGTDQADPSSRSAGRAGSLALYTWLDDLGFQVHRVSGDFDLAGSDVLLSLDPSDDFGPAEVTAMLGHLATGGDVVVALDPATRGGAGHALLERFGITVAGGIDAPFAFPAQPIDAGGRVDRVPMGVGLTLAGPPDLVPLLEAGGRTVAAALRPPGGGRLYLVGTTHPFANDGLRLPDSPGFVLTLLERARGGRVAFDEFHHGEGHRPQGAAAVLVGPVGVAALIAAAIVLAYLALSGRRLGAPRPPAAASRVPTALTYVDAMAELYQRSPRRGGVAARYADELKRRLGADSGVDPRLPDGDFLAALGRHSGARVEEVAELLARARRGAAGDPSHRQLLDLAREVDTLERGWGSASGSAKPMATMLP